MQKPEIEGLLEKMRARLQSLLLSEMKFFLLPRNKMSNVIPSHIFRDNGQIILFAMVPTYEYHADHDISVLLLSRVTQNRW